MSEAQGPLENLLILVDFSNLTFETPPSVKWDSNVKFNPLERAADLGQPVADLGLDQGTDLGEHAGLVGVDEGPLLVRQVIRSDQAAVVRRQRQGLETAGMLGPVTTCRFSIRMPKAPSL